MIAFVLLQPTSDRSEYNIDIPNKANQKRLVSQSKHVQIIVYDLI